MTNIEKILSSIDASLKSISKSLAMLVNENEKEETEEMPKELFYEDEIDPHNKEATLFMELAYVYMEEENRRIQSGKNKKAARRISVNLGEAIIKFFEKELDVPDIKIERSKTGGLIVFRKMEQPVAVLKYMTDLGYSRGKDFYDVIKEVQQTAQTEFGVESENVFFLIASLMNSIEKPFVEKMIGEEIQSNLNFLSNKKQVQLFINNYLSGVTLFNDPKRNVYFMASELHPNLVGEDIRISLNSGTLDYYETLHKVNVYDWYCSLDLLVCEIKGILKNNS